MVTHTMSRATWNVVIACVLLGAGGTVNASACRAGTDSVLHATPFLAFESEATGFGCPKSLPSGTTASTGYRPHDDIRGGQGPLLLKTIKSGETEDGSDDGNGNKGDHNGDCEEDDDGCHGSKAVPLPNSSVLFGSAAMALLFLARRRRLAIA
jgi:hypothetical protein